MLFRRQPFLEWREPKAFLEFTENIRRQSRRWWHSLLLALVGGTFAFLRVFFDDSRPPLPTVFSWTIFGAFFPLLLFRLARVRFSLPKVRLYASSLRWTCTPSANLIRFKEVECFAWHFEPGFAILMLGKKRPGEYALIGVPVDFDRDGISTILQGSGVPEAPDPFMTTPAPGSNATNGFTPGFNPDSGQMA